MWRYWGGGETTQQKKVDIESLLKRGQVRFGAINVLIQDVILPKEQNLPKNDVLSLASSWKKNGVTDAKAAHALAEKIKEKKSRSYSNYKSQRPTVPFQSKEKTTHWITHQEEFKLPDEAQENLQKDKNSFLKNLKKKKRAGGKT
ncbi:replication initiation and membrane attachment family protein, partial [Staphylococcus chromogenes]